MEWVTLEFIWKTVLTAGLASGGYIYRSFVEQIEGLKRDNKELRQSLHNVQINYVQKNEIERIEERIDVRFFEMREFFTTILGLQKK
jgi:hypothetical protein